ncbi:hypothetical protein BV25DRAFT_1831230 [Artomyces pyxidatus]|uniref:Uncharacterized protein n=1 Tax=Artomyces pyxidatus TaxID=48021 RepID=A0ACB8SN73_9AGAM|nr:hypothetical protein BV25DRAFT_1831230 [Artomyces pyxidatus]
MLRRRWTALPVIEALSAILPFGHSCRFPSDGLTPLRPRVIRSIDLVHCRHVRKPSAKCRLFSLVSTGPRTLSGMAAQRTPRRSPPVRQPLSTLSSDMEHGTQ